MKSSLFFLLLTLLTACSGLAEKAQESVAENVAESILGQDFDQDNMNEISENKIIADLSVAGSPLIGHPELMKGSVHIVGENMVITVAGEGDEQKLVITLSGEGIFDQKPYEGNAILEGSDTKRQAMMVYSNFGSNAQEDGFMLADGNIKITSFSADEIIISVNGHAASPADLAAGANMKEISGTLSLIKPVLQAQDREISEILY